MRSMVARTVDRMRRWLSRLDDALLVVVLAAGGWWGYHHLVATPPATPVVRPSEARPLAAADPALAALTVKGRAPKTGYARDQFGRGWIDVDRNGCDTRNDILRRDLQDVAL